MKIPQLSLVILIGPSSSGKSSFARRHFLPTEIVSSDFCRALVSDDENSLAATADAFDLVRTIAEIRLRRGRLTVIDATNVQADARKQYVQLARSQHVLPVAIAFDIPERVLHDRHRERTDRAFSPSVISRQRSQMKKGLRGLEKEGFRRVFILRSQDEIDAITIEREPAWSDKRNEHGPFDIIGDVHGCATELEALLELLGYRREPAPEISAIYPWVWRHPDGRKPIFVGDLVDRGPRILETVELVRQMVVADAAIAVPGNHDVKFLRLLRGERVNLTHGLDLSSAEIDARPDEVRDDERKQMAEFIDGLVSHAVLDDGKLVVAHAGLPESMHGRASGAVRSFALFGDTTGETDELGLPVRRDWAAEYRGEARVVYGHTPVPVPIWNNNTMNIDTGCVYGGFLTALRWPEREVVQVPAERAYAQSSRPITFGRPVEETVAGDELDLNDFIGKRIITTEMLGSISIPKENGAAALELLSRFAIDPRWLIYIPPTMSPSETTRIPELLEHPDESFAYFRKEGVRHLVCEEKHMGSRSCILLFRDVDAAVRRLKVDDGRNGVCYTRTGRPFFSDSEWERLLLERLTASVTTAGFWEQSNTDWVLLDCELMPWSTKAQSLLVDQYASVGSAARHGLAAVVETLEAARDRYPDIAELAARFSERRHSIERYIDAYGHYCWSVDSIDDIRLAPFHILATEGGVHVDRDHVWHMETIASIADALNDPLLVKTPYIRVDLENEESVTAAITWWEELTGAGGEGMVVKPLDFITRSNGRLVQPALKCRGPEYLRIIYGPEYLAPDNLRRLRGRSVGGKRSLAAREFALGIEGLQRFVSGEPLRRVHECVHAVLALESEPVDPRL